MDYGRMTPLLVEAVNALRAEKNTELAERDRRIEELTARIEQLESLINRQHMGIAEETSR